MALDRNKDMIYENGVVICNSIGNNVTYKVIVTLGGSFLEG